MGGNNSKDNLVKLTAREHFVCHWLLTRMVSDVYRRKMHFALWRMLCGGSNYQDRYKPNSHLYEQLRKKFIENARGVKFSQEHCRNISKSKLGNIPWNKGKPRTDKEKLKMSQARRARVGTPGHNIRSPHSEETLTKLSNAARNRKRVTCPHCNTEADASNFKRWHGDKCKYYATLNVSDNSAACSSSASSIRNL